MKPSCRVLWAAVAIFLAGCRSSVGGTPTPTPTTSPSPTPTPSPSPSASCAEQVFASMTEAQRVGQLFIVGLRDDRLGPAEIAGIRAHHFGSVSFIVTTTEGVAGVRLVANAVQALATKSTTARVRFYVAAN